MDMLEDYLRAVSRLLPRAKRDDITAELRDEILTRIETREAELKRPLTPDETEQLLRDFGHPIVVAARYRDEPQYCVGPALYPYWMFAVRVAILIEVVVSAVVLVVRTLSGGNVGEAFGNAIGSGLTGAMTLIGFATAAAWLIERKGIAIDSFQTWRVRDLRFLDFAFVEWADVGDWFDRVNASAKVRAATPSGRPNADAGRDRGYQRWMMRQSSARRGVAAIAVGVVAILWWIGVLSFGLRPVPLDFNALHVDPGVFATLNWPAFKAAVFLPVLVYFAGLILFGILVLVYPRGVRVRGLIDLIYGVMVMACVAWVWTASSVAPFVAVQSAVDLGVRLQDLIRHPVPLRLERVATAVLVLTAFGGFCRAIGGLAALLVGAPRPPVEGSPA